MARALTERQEAFLDYLFGEAAGDNNRAAKLAGYSPNTGTQVARGLEEEILERAKSFLATNAPKAALAMAGMIDSVEPNTVQRLKVCTEILDRVGIVKKDKLEVSGELNGAIFWLPKKDEIPEEETV